MARWSEFFQNLLNIPGDREPEALEIIQQRRVNTALDEQPTVDEMVRALRVLNYGKAPRGDEFQQKYGNTVEPICMLLHRGILKIWEECHVPQA